MLRVTPEPPSLRGGSCESTNTRVGTVTGTSSGSYDSHGLEQKSKIWREKSIRAEKSRDMFDFRHSWIQAFK